MPYIFQTFKKDGTPHMRWRFQFRDWKGRRRTGTGATTQTETEKIANIVQTREDAIRKGWAQAPKSSDAPRDFGTFGKTYNEDTGTIAEYLAWGRSQGGKGGRPWDNEHATKRRLTLKWWKETMGFSSLHDLVNCLSRVEKALREKRVLIKKKKGNNKPEPETRLPTGKTLQTLAEALRAFCAWCVTRGYLEENPLDGLAPFDCTPKTVRRALTGEEIHKLLGACLPHRRLGYEVALASGLRRSELRSLQVRHLDIERGGLRLDPAFTKNRRPGFQPLPGWLVAKLAESSKNKTAEAPLVFVTVDSSVALEGDLRRAGLSKWAPGGKVDFHALRVAFVSFVMDSGADLKTAQTLARHSTPGLTMNTYARARHDRLTETAEAVGKVLNVGAENTTETQRKAVGAESLELVDTCAVSEVGSNPLLGTLNNRITFIVL